MSSKRRWRLIAALICHVSFTHSWKIRVLSPKARETVVVPVGGVFDLRFFLSEFRLAVEQCSDWTILTTLGSTNYSTTACNCWQSLQNRKELNGCEMYVGVLVNSSWSPQIVVNVLDKDSNIIESASTRPFILVKNVSALEAKVESLQLLQRAGVIDPELQKALNDLKWISNLYKHEKKIYSQNGEDGVLQEVFSFLGATNKFAVEFGSEEGSEVNTRALWEREGWKAVLLDGEHENRSLHPNASLFQRIITKENIVATLVSLGVPREFDLLSVDIDFNDFWVLNNLLYSFSPRVVIAEVNRNFEPSESFTVPYDADMYWTGRRAAGFPHGTCYYGMSAKALDCLARFHGYTMIYLFADAINAVIVRDDLLSPKTASLVSFESLMPAPLPGLHAAYEDVRPWIEVSLVEEPSRRGKRQLNLHLRRVWMFVDEFREEGQIREISWPFRMFAEDIGAHEPWSENMSHAAEDDGVEGIVEQERDDLVHLIFSGDLRYMERCSVYYSFQVEATGSSRE